MTEKIQNFLSGMSATLCLFPAAESDYDKLYPYKTDTDAIRSDFEKVGEEIKGAMKKVVNE